MDEKFYQDVFDILQSLLPEGWVNVAFFAALEPGAFIMNYFTDHGDGYYIAGFDEEYPGRNTILKAFLAINEVITQYRGQMKEDKQWNVFSMFVDNTGKMRSEFEYDKDVSDLSFQEHWINEKLRTK